MAYVNMTKDFSEMRRPIPGLGLTKRQVLALALGALCGIPAFLIAKLCAGADTVDAVMVMAAMMSPISASLLYRKDGMYIEEHLGYWYETHHVRDTERPYVADNIYDAVLRSQRLQEEVEGIIYRGKSTKEIEEMRASGATSEVRLGRERFTIPAAGPIDRATKRELEKAVRKAKLTGRIPESAQETIPYRIPYEDGIFESAEGYYTQTVAFDDITYQLLDNGPKNILFERWCRLLNYFDPEVHFQFNYANMEMDKGQYSRDLIIPPQDDGHNIARKEYSDMLVGQFAKGTNNLKKERYLTYGIHAADYRAAQLRMSKINKQVEQHLKRLGCRVRVLDGHERLELLFRIFHPASAEKFLWNFDLPVRTGLTSKDFIAPSSFSFKNGPDLNATRYFRCGDRIGAVSYIKVSASEMEDRIISDIMGIDSNVWISIHADALPRDIALRLAEDNIAKVQGMIMNEQKNANQSGYDMYMLPPEMESYRDAGDKLYRALQRKDEQLFNAVITVVQTAATRKELEANIFELNGILSPYQCTLVRLDNRQEQGYMSSLPLGNNSIKNKRTYRTTDLAIFIPFTTKELYWKNGQYYGMNSLSSNVITVDRKELVNPNGLVFGMPGYGKTFFVKREILDVMLRTEDDQMIIDPEGEYRWLVRMLGGQVITIALNSPVHINPMDIDLFARNEEDREYDPISAKVNFIVSLCELILGNDSFLGKREIATIDLACKNVYRKYAEDPVPEKMPVLGDLYAELRNLDSVDSDMGEIGRGLSVALSRYTDGSLSYFNHRSNVDINARLVCFDLKEMDKNQRDLTMLIVQEAIWDRVAANRGIGKSTWIDIDEFHILLRDPKTAAYSVDIWKRFRKWSGIPTGITQNVKDMFRSQEIENILDTTSFVAMLNQSGDDVRLLSEHFGLSEYEEEYIRTGEAGKGLLCVGKTTVPFEDSFPKDTVCYKVMTTKPREAITTGPRRAAKP